MTILRHALALLVATAAGAGCVERAPDLELQHVEPASGWTGESIDVIVRGEGFFPSMTADAGGKGATVDDRHRLALLDGDQVVANLDQVSLLSPTQISARVPSGVLPGRYDLSVRSPRGAEVVLPRAFTVRATPAQRLVLDPQDDERFWLVEQTATIDAYALDADGEQIAEPLEVRVRIDPLDPGAVLAGFPDDVLMDQVFERRQTGASILGRLHADGMARIPVTVSSPASVLVRLEALEHGIESANLRLDWYDRADYRVLVHLDSTDDELVAGQSFVAMVTVTDPQGAVVENPVFPIDVTLRDACDELELSLRDLRGTTQVPLVLRRATGDGGCAPTQQLQVEHRGDLQSSKSFQIAPGPVQRFSVELPSQEFTAGASLTVRARPVDVFGNVTTWSGPPTRITVRDTVGDVSTDGCVRIGRELHCSILPTLAERGVLLIVRDPADGLAGASLPYNVRPGPIAGIEVEAEPGDHVRAGAGLQVQLRPHDAYFNLIEPGVFSASDFVVSDLEFAEAECSPLSAELRQECRLFTATEAARLVATGPASSLGTSTPIRVTNAELAAIEVNAQHSPVIAGQPFDLQLIGRDAFGNRYTEQSDPSVHLQDHTSTLSPGVAHLGASGEVVVSATLTLAQTTVVTASQGGRVLGTSGPVEVRAGELSTFVMSSPPWWFEQESVDLYVEALDAHGNRVPSSTTLELTSATGAVEPTVGLLDGGRAVFRLTPIEPAIPERLTLHASGVSVEHEVLIAARCDEAGPEALLTLEGDTQAVVCHEAEPSSLAVELSATRGTPEHVRIAVNDRAWISTAEGVLHLEQVGQYRISGLVVDGICGAEASATAWAAPDDGGPAGPIAFELAPGPRHVGQDEELVLTGGPVLDCRGELATHGEVELRATRGDLNEVMSSGSGLYALVEPDASVRANLDLIEAHTGGLATLYARVDGERATGALSFDLLGDIRGPSVVRQSPEGAFHSRVDRVELHFDEPLDPASIELSHFEIEGPTPVTIHNVTLEAPDRVVVHLSSSIDASLGSFALRVFEGVTDLAGNAIEPLRTASAAPYEGRFGNVSASVPADLSCAAEPTTFRPDGDDGLGIDSATSDFSFDASIDEGTWRIAVRDHDGKLWRSERLLVSPAVGGSWRFDGRDQTGEILRDGVYELSVTPHNPSGTSGPTCSVSVELAVGWGAIP
ncbi:MAG: hypothetical protein EA397_05265 [Deltaproteobacteria bacterium]|nr:MAG: hypothetical protein EA397_05265 [Deltaproteobacteria bacterium]